MALINDGENLTFFGDDGYHNSLRVLDGGNSGFFIIDTVRTPISWIGKKVIIKAFIVED